MSLVPLSFFYSSDSVVLQVLQTKPSVLFWSSQFRKEVKMFRRRFELLTTTVPSTQQNLRSFVKIYVKPSAKMFSCDKILNVLSTL